MPVQLSVEVTSAFEQRNLESALWELHIIAHHSAQRNLTSSSHPYQYFPPSHHDTKWFALMYEPIKPPHTLCSLRDPPSPSTLRCPGASTTQRSSQHSTDGSTSRTQYRASVAPCGNRTTTFFDRVSTGAQRRRWPGRTPLRWGATEGPPAAAGRELVTGVSHRELNTRYKVR